MGVGGDDVPVSLGDFAINRYQKTDLKFRLDMAIVFQVVEIIGPAGNTLIDALIGSGVVGKRKKIRSSVRKKSILVVEELVVGLNFFF